MLKIFNNLAPFIEDCYREWSVREYARLQNISPPTSSQLLKGLEKEGLLCSRKEYGRLFFASNRENHLFVDMARAYWRQKLGAFVRKVTKEVALPTIILFGSLSKAENMQDADVDIAIIGTKSSIKTAPFEQELKREFQVFTFLKLSDVPENLCNAIVNGYVLQGRIEKNELGRVSKEKNSKESFSGVGALSRT